MSKKKRTIAIVIGYTNISPIARGYGTGTPEERERAAHAIMKAVTSKNDFTCAKPASNT